MTQLLFILFLQFEKGKLKATFTFLALIVNGQITKNLCCSECVSSQKEHRMSDRPSSYSPAMSKSKKFALKRKDLT